MNTGRTSQSHIAFTPLALLSLTALGLALRLFGMGQPSLWYDEAVSVTVSQFDVPAIIESAGNDILPPVYYLLLHYWINFFGNGEVAVRSLSLVFGLTLIPCTYLV